MTRRLLWGLIPLGLDFNEKFSYGRRRTSLLEDRDADGNGRDGCTGAGDTGFVKCAFFFCLQFHGWIKKCLKVLTWANTFRCVSSAKQNPRLSLAAQEDILEARGRHLWEPVCLLRLAV